ncbi:EPIDERMAL PATTERNING FACTOR-like protein 6 [Typha latifolia]|uniref:EPIDERMAL PATTERNING FACTOR-like protein 6 n=1 Tax=Typha latifolia TaxID=4733 RepID=UPI003C2AD5A9
MLVMELMRGRRKGGSVSKVASLCLVLVFLFSACRLVASSDARGGRLDIRSLRTRFYTQGVAGRSRELIAGPGSYPPRCTSKCGNCIPCSPVHVPVPPSRPVIAEYYPEAWRCKCGNKLYMP